MATLLEPPKKSSASDLAVQSSDIWPLSVEHYHSMILAGILTEDDPLELIEGLLVKKMPKYPAHRLTTSLIRRALDDLVANDWYLLCQEPITLKRSEPEPDIIVVRGKEEDYPDRHPGPNDLGLVVEVAESSLDRDLGWKLAVYADARIVRYWVADLENNRIEVFEAPGGIGRAARFESHRTFNLADKVPVILDGHEFGSILVGDVIKS